MVKESSTFLRVFFGTKFVRISEAVEAGQTAFERNWFRPNFLENT